MKLPLLLTQFLYQHKKLNLPGIGSFTLDPQAVIPDEHNKDLHAMAMGIEFKNAVIPAADPELIEFIRTHTGKIRPLAIADLESFLTLGNELLNIGKPFYLEGIGTLSKNNEGGLLFTPGEYTTARLEETGSTRMAQPRKKISHTEEAHYEAEAPPNRSGKWLVTLAILAGIGLVAWGGYMMYKKNLNNPPERNALVPPDTATVKTDTVRSDTLKTDSAKTTPPVQAGPAEPPTYKFIILSTHNKERALKRYNQLLSYDLKVNLETKDSSFFKVYFSFPALARDTVHIKDSLSREYAHHIQIER